MDPRAFLITITNNLNTGTNKAVALRRDRFRSGLLVQWDTGNLFEQKCESLRTTNLERASIIHSKRSETLLKEINEKSDKKKNEVRPLINVALLRGLIFFAEQLVEIQTALQSQNSGSVAGSVKA